MTWTAERARVAALSRSRTPDDPDFLAAKRDLRAARAEDYIRQLVDSAPPLTPEQRDRLAVLLRPHVGDAARAPDSEGGRLPPRPPRTPPPPSSSFPASLRRTSVVPGETRCLGRAGTGSGRCAATSMTPVFVVTTTRRPASAGCWIASSSRTRIVGLPTPRFVGCGGSFGRRRDRLPEAQVRRRR